MKNKGILKFFAGLVVGIGIGLASNSIGIGIAVGIALGAAFSQGKIAWIFLNKTFTSSHFPIQKVLITVSTYK